jgi:hypothetical protein
MKDSYAGQIKNSGSQKVEPLYSTPKGKPPVKKTGGDLRTKGGK